MYAKLALSSNFTAASMQVCIRDMVRLLTSPNPTISLLSSSGGFNVGASSIIDATPAGWTYVGSNVDNASLNAPNSSTALISTAINGNSGARWVISAPCAAPNASKLKYAVFAGMGFFLGSNVFQNAGIQLAGATGGSVDGSTVNTGLLVQEYSGQGSASTNFGFGLQAATTYHLIANARHVTLIAEGFGVVALWEHSYSEVHQFLNQIPMVQFCQYGANGITSSLGGDTRTGINTYSATQTQSVNPVPIFAVNTFNTTNIGTGTTYGAYAHGNMTRPFQPYLYPHQGVKGVSVSATGLNRNIVNPIMFNHFEFGYPTIYVTGVVPAYMCRGAIGSPGDVVSINGTDYVYFPVNTQMGLALLTS